MAIAVTLNPTEIPNAQDITQQQVMVDCVLTLSGTYPTNGDTISFAGLGVPSNQVPTKVEIYEWTPAASGPPSGYAFIFQPGTDQSNGKMTLFNGTTQATTGTYASLITVTGFALRARAWFPLYV